MKEFTLSELGVFLGVVGGIVTSVLLVAPELVLGWRARSYATNIPVLFGDQ